ncbi:MAG: hypothetical protein NW220_00575 [Leptolyngbyaceae cyanobacterium bins.349]|nr:hypothetical protein [Leptolyngbyaceae cyanobacterium bins.349]
MNLQAFTSYSNASTEIAAIQSNHHSSQDEDETVLPPLTGPSLAALWARKYIIGLQTQEAAAQSTRVASEVEANSLAGRSRTAQFLSRQLSRASAQAWSTTETLLMGEIQRHQINPQLVDPWQIAADSHQLFQQCLEAYRDRVPPARLSVLMGSAFGQIRQKYTAHDPRTLGFVSMQFHYTGVVLLEQLSAIEQSLFAPYLKVMDDHLYMPLQSAYDAAANYEIDSPSLVAVQQLLPLSTAIAHAVCDHVCRSRPTYSSYSGELISPLVRVSSIRDVEMFQVYLCVCVLEQSICSVQQELFPLCVMLYPKLGVSWELVQEMLRAIGWELLDRLPPEHTAIFVPYLRALSDMFALEIFQ